jgi:hypothetical protein
MRAKCEEDDHIKETQWEELQNFKDYCNERWGMGRALANRLISGSKVAANLLSTRDDLYTLCEIQPFFEKQVRPLAQLEPEQQRTVWEEAVRTAVGSRNRVMRI